MATAGYKGISFPFRFNNVGGVAASAVAMDDPAHIIESVRQIVGTRRGERVMRPEFGADADDIVFSPQSQAGIQIAVHNIGQQVLRWEKRVELRTVEIDRMQDLETQVNIEMRIKVTRQEQELAIPMRQG